MASRALNQAYRTDSGAHDRKVTRRRASKDPDPARSECKRSEDGSPAALSTDTCSKSDTEYLQRQVQALEAKLAISELERMSERQASDGTIKSLRAINEELSKSLSAALEAKSASTPGDFDEPSLREDAAIQWEMSDGGWEDHDDAEPSRRKWLWKVFVPMRSGLLMIRRALAGEGQGKLALPGGYQMLGQTWQEAGVREVLEETGVVLDPSTLGVLSVETTPDRRQNLLFCASPPVERAGEFHHDPEVSEVLVVRAPVETAFALHTSMVRDFFDAKRR
jgi:8-oxo-dGTP pyrophosphatase MutT (NUDIX family)